MSDDSPSDGGDAEGSQDGSPVMNNTGETEGRERPHELHEYVAYTLPVDTPATSTGVLVC